MYRIFLLCTAFSSLTNSQQEFISSQKCQPDLVGEVYDDGLTLLLICNINQVCEMSRIPLVYWLRDGKKFTCPKENEAGRQCTIREAPFGRYQCQTVHSVQGYDPPLSQPYIHPAPPTPQDSIALAYGITFGLLVPVSVAVLGYLAYLCYKYRQLEQSEMFHPTASGIRRTTAASNAVVFRQKQNIYVPFPTK